MIKNSFSVSYDSDALSLTAALELFLRENVTAQVTYGQ
jgi:hypothetical protein